MADKSIEEGAELVINFAKRDGFVPCVVQDAANGQILMLAYVNQPALETTLEKGMATFWSTSRNELWTKGETSGDFLKIVDVLVDCDHDALIYQVTPQGAGACHTGRNSCFYRKVTGLNDDGIAKLSPPLGDKTYDPNQVYGKK